MDQRESARIVEEHLQLVRSAAARYRCSGEQREELVQAGALGLVLAARRFDPARRVPFAAYALVTIDGEIRRYLRDRSATVRVPRRERATLATLRRAAGAASARLGREASLAETASAAGVSLVTARRALRDVVQPVPLAEGGQRPSEAAAAELDACERRAELRRALETLAPREREAIALRFVVDLSQREVARRMRISQSQASRILAAALEKLRRELGASAATR